MHDSLIIIILRFICIQLLCNIMYAYTYVLSMKAIHTYQHFYKLFSNYVYLLYIQVEMHSYGGWLSQRKC